MRLVLKSPVQWLAPVVYLAPNKSNIIYIIILYQIISRRSNWQVKIFQAILRVVRTHIPQEIPIHNQRSK